MTSLDPKALEAARLVFTNVPFPQGTRLADGIQAYLDADNLVERRIYDDMVRTALRDKDELSRALDQEKDEVELQTALAETRGRQLAALKEALNQIAARYDHTILAAQQMTAIADAALTDTAAADAQYQPVGKLSQMLIEISEQPIPDVMAGAITCGGAPTQMDAAQIGWMACFQEFERRIKAMIAAVPNLSSVAEGEAGEGEVEW